MKRKPSQTQQLLQSIMETYKLKDINEAWRIYHQKYEVDIELDPAKIYKTKPVINRRADT